MSQISQIADALARNPQVTRVQAVFYVVVDDAEAELFARIASGQGQPNDPDYCRTYAELHPMYVKTFGDDGQCETLTEYAQRRLGLPIFPHREDAFRLHLVKADDSRL